MSIGGFNSRAREGRDKARRRGCGRGGVSIHAPARGATLRPSGRCRGRTCFNSRAREGRDVTSADALFQFFVSIHAPARGATLSGRRQGWLLSCFNSRAREGRDKACRSVGLTPSAFQFTRPRGARLCAVPCLKVRRYCFNSRAREGRDGEFQLVQVADVVSIHAPARGATRILVISRWACSSFNSRAREGRDSSISEA